MTAWLLTWNPDNWHWDNYDEDCKAASKENPIEFVWSCHSKKPQIGDEFYLMKLGKLPRGIIAHGIVTKGMVPGDRWDGEKKRGNSSPFRRMRHFAKLQIAENFERRCP